MFIERIDISGNNRTLDRVIRRQFNVVEGDAFNSREINDAQDRIRGLGYFEEATVNVRPGTTEDQALIDVQVVEQPTGSLTLGGAFSSSEGLTAQVGLTERNFLGRGQTVSATVSGQHPVRQLRVRLHRAGALRPRPLGGLQRLLPQPQLRRAVVPDQERRLRAAASASR